MNFDLLRGFAVACLLTAPAAGYAQQAIAGRVVNSQTQEPVDGASVLLFAPGGAVQSAATSDSVGAFRFDVPTPGLYTLQVHRIGFAPARNNPVAVDANSIVAVTVPLTPTVVMLEGVTVEGDELPGVSRIREFEQRRRFRVGYSFNREDFERLNARYVGDLLPEIPGFVPLGGGSPAERSYAINRNRCPPSIWINGYPSALPATELIETLSLWTVYGIEVIPNWSEIPAEYTTRGRPGCGVILIWTRLMEQRPP